MELQNVPGETIIKRIISIDEIQLCRSNCDKAYPLWIPGRPISIKRLIFLGTKELPAWGCMDLFLHGSQNLKSGNYFFKFSENDDVKEG